MIKAEELQLNNQEKLSNNTKHVDIEKPSIFEKAKNLLTNKEIMKQVVKTGISSMASIAGVKSFYDVPAYFKQKFEVIKDKNEYNEIFTNLGNENTEAEEIENKKVAEIVNLDQIDAMQNKIEGMDASEEIKNKLTQELNSLVENYHNEMDTLKSGENEKLTTTLDEYVKTKISGVQASKEALNTLFVASGAYGLRGLSYGALSVFERHQKLLQEANKEGEEVNFMKDVVVNGAKETFQEATFQGEGTKTQKALKAIKSFGSLARFAGIAETTLSAPENYDQAIDKLLNTLDGDTNWGEAGQNFVQNIESNVPFVGGVDEAEAGEINPEAFQIGKEMKDSFGGHTLTITKIEDGGNRIFTKDASGAVIELRSIGNQTFELDIKGSGSSLPDGSLIFSKDGSEFVREYDYAGLDGKLEDYKKYLTSGLYKQYSNFSPEERTHDFYKVLDGELERLEEKMNVDNVIDIKFNYGLNIDGGDFRVFKNEFGGKIFDNKIEVNGKVLNITEDTKSVSLTENSKGEIEIAVKNSDGSTSLILAKQNGAVLIDGKELQPAINGGGDLQPETYMSTEFPDGVEVVIDGDTEYAMRNQGMRFENGKLILGETGQELNFNHNDLEDKGITKRIEITKNSDNIEILAIDDDYSVDRLIIDSSNRIILSKGAEFKK